MEEQRCFICGKRRAFPLSDSFESPSEKPQFKPVIARNIGALVARRQRDEARLGFEERLADAITRFAGSMRFVCLHLALFGVWIAWNAGPFRVHKFDPQLIILAMWASVEAIFLSTFILIAQNCQTRDEGRRADLDLQVNLLAEHELLRLIALVSHIAEKIGLEAARSDVYPKQVLDQIETLQANAKNGVTN